LVKTQAGLLCLQDLGRWDLKLSAEDAVPETTGDAKAVLVIGKVMLQVVFLELLVVERQAGKKLKISHQAHICVDDM
jgi:hypothetical protein